MMCSVSGQRPPLAPPPLKKTESPVSFSPEPVEGPHRHLFSLQLPSRDPSLQEPRIYLDCHSANVMFFYEVIDKFISRVIKREVSH